MKKSTSRRSKKASGTRASHKDLPVRKSKDVKGGFTAGLPKSVTSKSPATDEGPTETITFTYGTLGVQYTPQQP